MNNAFKHIKLSSTCISNFVARNLKLDAGSNRLCSTFRNPVKFPQRSLPTVLAPRITYNASICRHASVSARKELNEFLEEEIKAEEGAQETEIIPSKIGDFNVTLDGTEVTLTKQNPGETVEVCFNVNDTIQEANDLQDGIQPDFEINIVRGDTTLCFSCSYLNKTDEGEEDDQYENREEDKFFIGDVAIFKGTFDDKTYRVAGDILDGSLYSLLMAYLEEKGITNQFIEEMSDLASAYERSSYICLLRELKKFTL